MLKSFMTMMYTPAAFIDVYKQNDGGMLAWHKARGIEALNEYLELMSVGDYPCGWDERDAKV